MGARGPTTMNQYISHPACARDAQRWLDRIATPAEKARALQLLTAVGGAPQEEAASDAAHGTSLRPTANSSSAPWASSSKGEQGTLELSWPL